MRIFDRFCISAMVFQQQADAVPDRTSDRSATPHCFPHANMAARNSTSAAQRKVLHIHPADRLVEVALELVGEVRRCAAIDRPHPRAADVAGCAWISPISPSPAVWLHSADAVHGCVVAGSLPQLLSVIGKSIFSKRKQRPADDFLKQTSPENRYGWHFQPKAAYKRKNRKSLTETSGQRFRPLMIASTTASFCISTATSMLCRHAGTRRRSRPFAPGGQFALRLHVAGHRLRGEQLGMRHR